MLFEHLVSPEIKEAVEKGLIAILPIGSIEVHGPHMPTGTDAITVYEVAKYAAEKEAAVVLPPFYYAYVLGNRHFPGTISLNSQTLLSLLKEVCDEVARNGFNKIFILNGHGGNTHILRVFLRDFLTKPRSYVIYLTDIYNTLKELAPKLIKERVYGHACEVETSIGLNLFQNLIQIERITQEAPLGSTDLSNIIQTPVDWQAYAPWLYLGDPRLATTEKGQVLVSHIVDQVAKLIREITCDTTVPRILSEYYKKAYASQRSRNDG